MRGVNGPFAAAKKDLCGTVTEGQLPILGRRPLLAAGTGVLVTSYAGPARCPAAFAATCAFMLPVGTPPNAIVFSTGAVTIADMARGSLVMNFVGIVLITLFCYLLGGAALGFRF